MKFKTLLSAAFILSCLTATAQEEQVNTEYVFNPHWYIQAQIGGQETLGETSFGKLLAPNAQLAGGYQFNPVIGARLAVNGWQSKASIEFNGKHRWKWNYVAPMADVTVDLTNLFGGYNPKRLVSVGVFAGIGANVGFKNDEAVNVSNTLSTTAQGQVLRLLWDGTKARFVGHAGANLDFRLSDRVKLGVELQANTLPDGYNSKKAGNADWYFNALVGVKYSFGKTYTKRDKKKCCANTKPEPIIKERIVEKIVERPVQVEVVKEVQEPIKRSVFFTISNTNITINEKQKVKEVVEYMKKYPESTVVVTGYADKGTGTKAINERLSNQRAQVVVDEIVKEGIAADRITKATMGDDEEQPYDIKELNRVAICVVK